MKIIKAYKYRIYPTEEQKVLLNKTFGCVRFIWNMNVELFNSWDKEKNPKQKYRTIKEIRSELEWMKEVSYCALHQKQRDFIKFKNQYFSKSKKKKLGRCSFKKRADIQSFRLTKERFSIKKHKIRIEKIGLIKLRIDRYVPKDAKYFSITISKDKVGKFFASVNFEIEQKVEKTSKKSIGIDLGLKDFIILSNGKRVSNPRFFSESQAKLARLQRHLSRKKKGSNRFRKCKLKVARAYSSITNQRKWFHHQVSSDLVKEFGFIGVEDLSSANMMKNHKLAKSIADAGWSQFISFLTYKSNWKEQTVQKIGRFYPSSQLCSNCGNRNKELKLSDRKWKCSVCNTELDRDVNAAKNILKQALGVANAIRTQSHNKTKVSSETTANDVEAFNKLKKVG